MSEAYASTLHISFEVRGGLLIRQIHHWAALLFVAGMTVHMLRVFFTGAYRKPRELNWIIGVRAADAGAGRGPHRLLPPRRPALRRGSADHRGRGDLDPDRRHVHHVLPVRRGVSGRGRHLAVLLAAHPADPRHPAGPHLGPHGADVGAEAHPDARPGPHRAQRGGRAVLPGLHGQGRRLLPVHVHGRRAVSAPSPRSTRSGCSVPYTPADISAGSPARLVHGLPGRRAAAHAVVGDQLPRPHGAAQRADPGAGADGHHHDGPGALSVRRAVDHRRPRASTTWPTAPATPRSAPRSAWRA